MNACEHDHVYSVCVSNCKESAMLAEQSELVFSIKTAHIHSSVEAMNSQLLATKTTPGDSARLYKYMEAKSRTDEFPTSGNANHAW